jgi:hypothetical protein
MEEPFRLVDLIKLNFCPICFMIYSTTSYAAISLLLIGFGNNYMLAITISVLVYN